MSPSTIWILPPLGTVKTFWKDVCFRGRHRKPSSQPLQQLSVPPDLGLRAFYAPPAYPAGMPTYNH